MGICFVPECKSGYPSQRREYKTLGKRIPSLFSCKTQDLEKWNRAIPRADRPLTGKDKVCELHFNVNDIERYYSQKFPDGTTQVLERGKPSLKPGVIPTIFPNLPDRFSKKSEKRKSPIKRVPPAKKIKRFFSMMRNACGSNDHPDSTMFLQVYRLLSTYSLVKPPRGSNITGGEIVQFLFNSSDISYVKEDQEIFNEKLHTILQQGGSVSLFNTDHDYTNSNSSDCIIYYLAGYFAWRAQRLTKCVECSNTLTSSEEKGAEISKLIDLKEKTLLSRPSNAMYTLVRLVEESTMNVTSKGPLHVDSFMDVLNDLEGRGKIPLLGCLNHQLELSEGILKMCLITRLHLICKRANYIDSFKAAKARKLRKFSKLS